MSTKLRLLRLRHNRGLLRGEQLGVEALAELARLSELGRAQILAEQVHDLGLGVLQKTLGGLGARLDLEAHLRRASRELELVPGQLEAMKPMRVTMFRSAVAKLADGTEFRVELESRELANSRLEPVAAQDGDDLIIRGR